MTPGPKTFARLGLAASAIAVFLATAITGSVAEQKSAIAAAALLVVCESAAALIAAGANERKRRPAVWIRIGVIAALASFVAIFALAVPTVLFTVLSGSSGSLIIAMSVLALALVFGGWAIMRIHEIVWRRFTPKGDA
jgi:hypothetical protein